MECRLFTSFADLLNGKEGVEFQASPGLAKRVVVGENGYEGGEDLWECSVDLARYITDHPEKVLRKDKPSLKVLELGCGSAAPSVALARGRAQAELRTELVLQERDARALNYTYSEISKNFTLLERPFVDVKLLVAPWDEMKDLETKFDVILMSETLYRVEVFAPITDIIRKCLDREHGLCLSAQKRFYFGVGGGSVPYLSYLVEHHPDLKAEAKAQLSENNQRDIHSITF